jgi:WD40 repeat protein
MFKLTLSETTWKILYQKTLFKLPFDSTIFFQHKFRIRWLIDSNFMKGKYLVKTGGKHKDVAMCVCVDDRVVISGSRDGEIQVYSLIDNQRHNEFYHHDLAVSCLELTDRYLYSGSWDTTVKIWERNSKTISLMEYMSLTHSSSVICLAMTNTKLLVGEENGTISIWNIEGFYLECKLHDSRASGLISCVGAVNTKIVAGQGNSILFWDLQTAESFLKIELDSGTINGLVLNEERLIICSDDGSVHSWSNIWSQLNFNGSLREPKKFIAHERGVRTVITAGAYLITGSFDHTIAIWDLERFEKIYTLAEHSGDVNCIQFHNGNLVSSSGISPLTR